jgi:hypothetical protein
MVFPLIHISVNTMWWYIQERYTRIVCDLADQHIIEIAFNLKANVPKAAYQNQ